MMSNAYTLPVTIGKLILASFVAGLFATACASADSPIRPGDHVAIIGNTFADQLRIHGYLETLLLQHTRENPISIRNLGWGGDMLTVRDRPTGFPSEESTLTDHKTDVILACFGMGESFAGGSGVDEFKHQLKALLAAHSGKQYNGKSAVRVVLVSPIAYEDLGELTPNSEKRNRELADYTQAMREVAEAADVRFVDLYETSRYLMNEKVGPKLTNNGIHLNAYGYWAMSHTFFASLVDGAPGSGQPSWLLRIDAAAESAETRGVEISDLTHDDSDLKFFVTEKAAPTLRPPTNHLLPPQLQFLRDTLVVKNLPPGTYQLAIDDQVVVTASAESWADGVAIDGSPAHRSAEAYRAAVNDKNLQFTYSWKALNQVHIVGERRTSPSGKALPQEVVEFNQLADDLEEALGKGVPGKTRRWRLSRVQK